MWGKLLCKHYVLPAALVPWMVAAAFLLMLPDAVDGIVRPPIGAQPHAIGFRQLGVSATFVLLMVLA
jgi:hypothetical protein